MKINKGKIGEYISEFLGSFFLVLTILLSGIIIGGNELIYQGVKTKKFEPFLIGFGLAILIYAFGRYSKAHFNPIVTWAMALTRKIRILDAITYTLLQFLAALAAYPIANWIRYQFIDFSLTTVGEGATSDQISNLRIELAKELSLTTNFTEGFGGLVFGVEMLFSLLFVLVILLVATNKELRKFAGFIIGTTLAIITMLGAFISGASYHPFRSLVPAIINREDSFSMDNIYVYVVAPMMGATIAAIIYLVLQYSEGNFSFPRIGGAKKVTSVSKKEEKVAKKSTKK